MLYINDPRQKYKTYDEVVEEAVSNGVPAKRAYIYLAAMGVKSVPVRVLSSDGADYLPPVKMAIKNKKLVSVVKVCGSCKSLVVR
jgi:hypothetical protein